jgi:hypothetical protein
LDAKRRNQFASTPSTNPTTATDKIQVAGQGASGSPVNAHTTKRLLRRKRIEAIADALSEIKAHFEFEGISFEEPSPAGEPPEAESEEKSKAKDEQDEDGYDDDEYDDDSIPGKSAFEREEIEIALDVFMSRLVEEKVIRQFKPNEQPSFSGIFEKFFDEDHEIVKIAQSFEEHIEGYFDWVHYDDMRAAYGELLQIKDIISKEIAANAQK